MQLISETGHQGWRITSEVTRLSGFGFNEAQEMFRTEVRNFAQKELAPGAKARAKQHKLPRDVVRKLGDMGLLGIPVPERYCGQGSDWVSFAIGTEEAAKADLFAGLYMMLP